MKPTLMRHRTGFTLGEFVVVIFMVLILLFLLDWPPSRVNTQHKARQISCMFNLKQIGSAYGDWEHEHGGQTPASASVSLGGWSELLTNAEQGPNCWTNYAILADALVTSPKIVMCPADERQAVMEFFTNAMLKEFRDYYSQKTDYFHNNTNLSYFVGVSANTKSPQSLLGGDRNLGGGKAPDSDFGFSPGGGKGNDVAIPISGPVSWSLKMHSAGNTAGSGNILLGDGSAQQVSTKAFNQTWLRNAPATTNWPAGHVPATPSIRLVFP
jgi:competence protein ComGC